MFTLDRLFLNIFLSAALNNNLAHFCISSKNDYKIIFYRSTSFYFSVTISDWFSIWTVNTSMLGKIWYKITTVRKNMKCKFCCRSFFSLRLTENSLLRRPVRYTSRWRISSRFDRNQQSKWQCHIFNIIALPIWKWFWLVIFTDTQKGRYKS